MNPGHLQWFTKSAPHKTNMGNAGFASRTAKMLIIQKGPSRQTEWMSLARSTSNYNRDPRGKAFKQGWVNHLVPSVGPGSRCKKKVCPMLRRQTLSSVSFFFKEGKPNRNRAPTCPPRPHKTNVTKPVVILSTSSDLQDMSDMGLR